MTDVDPTHVEPPPTDEVVIHEDSPAAEEPQPQPTPRMVRQLSTGLSKGLIKKHRGSIIGALLEQLSERFPKYKKQIDAVTPFCEACGNALDAVYPYMRQGYGKLENAWNSLEPYNPQQFGPILLGFIICFFGGSYLTLIAAIECVRIVVWQRMFNAFKVLVINYNLAYDASKADDLVDEDGNGIADVLEISKKELLTRKLYLFFRTVDPDQISEALATIWAGILSVVATLRVHFAQAITLGCSIGEIVDGHLRKQVEPVIIQVLPEDMKRWGPVGTGYLFRFLGCLVAWFIKRIITGFHAAMRGANMMVINGIVLARKKGYVAETFDEHSPQASLLTALIAFMGFYWQLSNNFGVPPPLNIIMFPVSVCEWILSMWVAII